MPCGIHETRLALGGGSSAAEAQGARIEAPLQCVLQSVRNLSIELSLFKHSTGPGSSFALQPGQAPSQSGPAMCSSDDVLLWSLPGMPEAAVPGLESCAQGSHQGLSMIAWAAEP